MAGCISVFIRPVKSFRHIFWEGPGLERGLGFFFFFFASQQGVGCCEKLVQGFLVLVCGTVNLANIDNAQKPCGRDQPGLRVPACVFVSKRQQMV